MLWCVKSKLPDVGPAGSVGQCQDGGFIFGQTRHYSKDYIFYTIQNFPAANKDTIRMKNGQRLQFRFCNICKCYFTECNRFFRN